MYYVKCAQNREYPEMSGINKTWCSTAEEASPSPRFDAPGYWPLLDS